MERVKCTRCNVSLPKDHFNVKRNGDLFKNCIQCNQNRRKYVNNTNKCEHHIIKSKCDRCKRNTISKGVLLDNGMKQCSKCNQYKLLDEFHMRNIQKCQHMASCKECTNEINRQRTGNNKRQICKITCMDNDGVGYYEFSYTHEGSSTRKKVRFGKRKTQLEAYQLICQLRNEVVSKYNLI